MAKTGTWAEEKFYSSMPRVSKQDKLCVSCNPERPERKTLRCGLNHCDLLNWQPWLEKHSSQKSICEKCGSKCTNGRGSWFHENHEQGEKEKGGGG